MTKELLIERISELKLEQTKEESDTDWFFGRGYNQALDDVLKIVREV